MSTGNGLDGLLDRFSRCLDTESARRIIDFQIDLPVQEQIDALAGMTDEDALTESELSEYEALINAADLISVLKLKVRHRLDSPIQ